MIVDNMTNSIAEQASNPSVAIYDSTSDPLPQIVLGNGACGEVNAAIAVLPASSSAAV